MKDIIELFSAVFMICQSLFLVSYMFLAAFFFVFILNRKDVYDRVVFNATTKLEKIALIAKSKSM